MDLEDFVARLDNVRQLPSGVSARCPAHDDHVSSLMVNTGREGGIVLHCHAGCSARDVVSALGLSLMDLMGKPTLVTVHDYVNERGELVYQVERWANPKTFRCVPGLPPPANRILYQCGAVAWARANAATIYICEGEKDVDRLIAAGMVATCNVGGAGKWLPHYSETLRDCHVVVIADDDLVGRKHARHVAASVRPYAASVTLTRPRAGKDAAELLEAGYTLHDGLEPLSEQEEIASYRAADVQTRSVAWAWHHYVPLGKLSLIEGDPGDGKSILTIDLAARWSTGANMPDGTNGVGPWPVILVSAEDDIEDTIVPRLAAAGARLEAVHLICHGITPDVPFEFSSGLSNVEELARSIGARGIIFDPLMAFISDDTDTHSDHSVRRALQPLKTLAQNTGAAVIAVRHLNKSGGGVKAIYRGGGSIAFTGAARATFLVTSDHSDRAAKIFAPVKSNLAPTPPSLRYRVEANADGIPSIVWGGAAGIDAQTALDGPQLRHGEDEESTNRREQRRYEMQFLVDLLEVSGPMPWKEIVAAGKAEGFNEHGLRYARAEAHLEKITGSEGNRTTTWGLPNVTTTVDSDDSRLTIWGPSGAVALGPPGAGKRASGSLEGEVLDAPSTTERDRDAELAAAPLECSECGTRDGVMRVGAPHWSVRCVIHNPFIIEAD